MLEKAKTIVVEGPIGVGKTSLAQRLAERLGAAVLLERPQDNPFLGRFYQDMDRHALATQISFLLQRIELLRVPPNAGRVVADFLLDKDPLFAAMTLVEEEHRLYRALFERLAPAAAPPDLVIYLQADSGTLIERVRRRAMESERKITESYLARVADRYAKFFYQYDAAPLFIVNAEVLNPVDIDQDFELLLERLRGMRSYREFFGYSD